MQFRSIDQTRHGLLCHPLFRLLVDSELPWRSPLSSSLLTCWSRLEVDFRNPWSLPDNSTVPSGIGNLHCSPLFGVTLWSALSSRAWTSDVSKISSSSMSATKISPFQIHSRNQCVSEEPSTYNFLTKLVEPWLVFRRNRMIFIHCTTRDDLALKWFSESPFIKSFPTCQVALNIPQITVAFHWISPPFFIQARLQQYSKRTFFYSAYRSLSSTICLWSIGCWCTMIPW